VPARGAPPGGARGALLAARARLGRPRGERVGPPAEDAPRRLELVLAPEELVPRLGPCPEAVEALAARTDALDQADAQQHPRRRADRALAGLQAVGELGRALLGRVADEQPAEDAADHARRAGV